MNNNVLEFHLVTKWDDTKWRLKDRSWPTNVLARGSASRHAFAVIRMSAARARDRTSHTRKYFSSKKRSSEEPRRIC
jgi:hypothetical protein